MSEYKKKAAWFAFYDRAKIEAELQTMSERGWIIDRPGSYFWRYRKAEPKKRKVTVVYVADASEFNSRPTAGQELLRELCEAEGWTLEASWGQMQIYYNEAEDPAPIETDPVTQVESIHRAMKKNGLPAARMSLLDGVLWPLLVWWQFCQDPAEVLSNSMNLLLVADGILMMTAAGIDLLCARLWYRKALEAAEQGEYLEFWNHRKLTWVLMAFSFVLLGLLLLSFAGQSAALLLFFAPVLAVVFLVNHIMKVSKESGLSRRANLGIGIGAAVALSIVMLVGVSVAAIHFHLLDETKPVGTYEKYGRERDVYADELPLVLEDLTDTGDLQYSREKRGKHSPLAARYEYRQWPLTEERAAELRYTVTDLQWELPLEHCLTHLLEEEQDFVENGEVLEVNHYEEADPAPWGAEAVWQLRYHDGLDSRYVLRYGSRIVELQLEELPTPNQQAVIGERLKP